MHSQLPWFYVMWLLHLVLSVILTVWIIRAVDCWFCPRLNSVGVIQQKIYNPPVEKTMTVIIAGVVPHTTPAVRILKIKVADRTVDIRIKNRCLCNLYNRVSVGDRLHVRYFKGRLSRHIYLLGLE